MSNFRNLELIHTPKSISRTAIWKEGIQKFNSSDVELPYSNLASLHCSRIFGVHTILLIHRELMGKLYQELLASQVSSVPKGNEPIPEL